MNFLYPKIKPEDVYISVFEKPNVLKSGNFSPLDEEAKGFRPTPNDFMNIFITILHTRGNCTSACIAKYMGIKTLELQYAIPAMTGLSMAEWKERYILLMANDLVKNTELPMNEVAKRLGFASQEGFNRFYKRMTKKQPLEMRRGYCYHLY